MVLVNLVVGGTMWVTMRGWMLMEGIKRELSSSDHFHINQWLKNGIGPIETVTIARIDDFFVDTSIFLCFYWVVFGIRVSWKYGAEEDLYCLLLAFPAILVLAIIEVSRVSPISMYNFCSDCCETSRIFAIDWPSVVENLVLFPDHLVLQVYLSVVILRINEALSELDCEKLRGVLSYNNLSMIVDLRNFMVEQGVTIAALFVTSAAVQLVTAALPFFLRFVKCVITILSQHNCFDFKFTATSLFKGAFTWTCFSSTT